MYRLKRPTNSQLTDFYNAYGPRIQTLMSELADGTQTIHLPLGRGATTIHLTLKVQNGSRTSR